MNLVDKLATTLAARFIEILLRQPSRQFATVLSHLQIMAPPLLQERVYHQLAKMSLLWEVHKEREVENNY